MSVHPLAEFANERTSLGSNPCAYDVNPPSTKLAIAMPAATLTWAAVSWAVLPIVSVTAPTVSVESGPITPAGTRARRARGDGPMPREANRASS